ncbi:hypothetical protein NPIL_1151 [Nephila pilipes]|uniref:Uncharacterized protein n=1 Tax=Nephila pilipes TaxID=299642 RepID=A0A8X6Q9N6_NEPPI|nr:hypothetical protein NPIL_1151 [Nephila pilipes]
MKEIDREEEGEHFQKPEQPSERLDRSTTSLDKSSKIQYCQNPKCVMVKGQEFLEQEKLLIFIDSGVNINKEVHQRMWYFPGLNNTSETEFECFRLIPHLLIEQ